MKYLCAIACLLITFPGCSRYQLELASDRQKNETIAKQLYIPLDKYLLDRGNYPEHLSELRPNYIKKLPTTVAGYKFKYANFRNLGNEFTISWYQSDRPNSLMNKKIVGCGIRRKKSNNGDFKEISECWNAAWENSH